MLDECPEEISQLKDKFKQLEIAHGGDGAIVSCWRRAHDKKKIILPIRNYGLCEKHKDFVTKLLAGDDSIAAVKHGLKMTTWPLLECRCQTFAKPERALAEFTITSSDITSALRFNVHVNKQLFLRNVISTGIIASAPLGATGYWSSVTRTIFRDGFGLAFIAPTIGVSNLVLKPADIVEVEITRGCEVKFAADKEVQDMKLDEGFKFEVTLSTEKISIAGFDEFHCQKCRELRHGTQIANQYLV